MRKVFCLAIIIALMLSGVAFAVTQFCKSYSFYSSSDAVTLVSNSSLTVGVHKILGFSVTGVGVTNPVAAIYDASTVGELTNANLLGEASGDVRQSQHVLFPYPKTFSNGVGIIQTAGSLVIIDYIK